MHIMYLVKRWEHHTRSGGYDALANTPGARVVTRPNPTGIPRIVARQVWKRTVDKSHLLDYRYEDWLAELKVMAAVGLTGWADVVHVLYGDEQLNVLLKYRSLLRRPLVATFHLPTSRTLDRFEADQERLLRGVDIAVAVSTNQLPGLERWFGRGRVVYVPHGIDTVCFTPDESIHRSRTVRLVSVGNCMRDWESLHRVMDECSALKLDVELDLVTQPEYFAFLTGCNKVKFHSGISEAELVSIYRKSDALLLPLLDATANNAILEAMACGTPVITTDVSGVQNYVGQDAGWLLPKGDVTSMVSLIKTICADREVAASKRYAARQQALKFDWTEIRLQLAAVYQTAITQKRNVGTSITRSALCD